MKDDFPPIFIDTGAWIAMNEKKDSNHKKAKSFAEKNRKRELNFGPIHTSALVLQETYTFLRYNYNYRAAIEIVDKVLKSKIIIHPFSSSKFEEIWKHIKKEDNTLSFVDWSTVRYMKEYGVQHIFTFDSDFENRGFKVLP